MDLIQKLRDSNQLIIGGHRGQLVEGIRENTIATFETILGKNVPYIEVDVQLTKDGELVLYHDHDLSLQTSLSGMIRDYTLSELRDVFELTRVEEAIIWAKQHQLGIAFELKIHPRKMWHDRDSIGNLLVELLQKHNFQKDCFVFGTDFALLKKVKQADESIPLAVIVPFIPVNPVQLMEGMQADIYLNFAKNLPKELVEELQEAGYLVDGSVVNDREGLELALDLGVDLIESDFPEELLQELEVLQ
ncbi:glycerophosphoryl diester phosphodiesterase [Streptococcus rupicaprae]|uniref:Glycerophosphoryl diester phosphodiesterase n=1 Tax=Streptococcus rupicaprae TaxID=759619 RepID=A0ABV2FGW0_9STRE